MVEAKKVLSLKGLTRLTQDGNDAQKIDHNIVIAISGPSRSGKSRLTKTLTQKL